MKTGLPEYVQRKAEGMRSGRNVILTDRISLINSRLRKMNISHGIDVPDTEPKLIRDIAEEIFRAYHSLMDTSDREGIRILTSQAECYVLEKILKQAQASGEINTIRSESISIPTLRDIRDCIRELRMNDTTPEWDASRDDKIADIKVIVSKYEGYLEERGEYDVVRFITEAERILDGLPIETADGLTVDAGFLIPWIKECNIGIPGDLKLSKIERRFADKLTAIPGVAGFEIEGAGTDVTGAGRGIAFSDKLKGHMYRAYGVANEIRQVTESIRSAGADVRFGDIQVFYSNPAYINYIRAGFDSEHIPYVLTNGYSAEELNLTQLMLSFIAFAADDFSYRLLREAMISPIITFANVTAEGTDSIRINPIDAYNDVLNHGIGWGRKRYADFHIRAHEEYNRYMNPDPNAADYDYAEYARPREGEADYEDRLGRWERKRDRAHSEQYMADFMSELTECFADELSTGEMLEKLWHFCGKYTYRKNMDRAKLSGGIYEAIDDLRYLDDKSLNMSTGDKLVMLDGILRSVRITDEPDPAAVSVSMIQGIQVIERSRVFITGLSAGQFDVGTGQSPILPDAEKLAFISGAGEESSPIVMAARKNELRRRDLYMTISTMEEGDITFIYNKYDTTKLKDSSPSVFFMEVADMLGIAADDVPDACGYAMATEDMRVDAGEMRRLLDEETEILAEIKEKRRKEQEAKEEKAEEAGETEDDKDAPPENEPKKKKAIRMSSTGMQTFLHCPLKYYYQYIRYLRVYDQKEQVGYKWLGPLTKGNLMHYTADRYFSEHMPRKAGYSAPKIAPDILRGIVRDQADMIEQTEPFMSPAIRAREEEEYYAKILEYFSFVTDNWCTEHDWVVIGCEIHFDDIEYRGRSVKHPVWLSLNGSIDRMDGYLETAESGNTLHIRILDYKTGRMVTKQKEVESGEQVQHFIYAIAAIDYLKKNEDHMKEVFGTDSIDSYSIDFIGYEHPYDMDNKTGYTYDTTSVVSEVEGNVLKGTIDELKVDFTSGDIDKLDRILGAYQHDDIEDIHRECIAHITDRILTEREEPSQKNYGMINFCEYCDHTDVCRLYIGGEEDALIKQYPGQKKYFD